MSNDNPTESKKDMAGYNQPATEKDIAQLSALIMSVNFLVGGALAYSLHDVKLTAVMFGLSFAFVSLHQASEVDGLHRTFWALLGKKEWL